MVWEVETWRSAQHPGRDYIKVRLVVLYYINFTTEKGSRSQTHLRKHYRNNTTIELLWLWGPSKLFHYLSWR